MTRIVGFVTFLALAVYIAYAVPPVLNYAGQVAVNGEAFNGNGLLKFALVNADGNVTYWSNDGTSIAGSEPQASVAVSVNGGLYSILLGNTAQQGMGAIAPFVFAQHTDAKLRVWFSDGVNGFQQLSPDRPFASVPYAFSAGTSQTAGSATIADGSINKSMLGSDVIADLNKTVTITRDMLPQDVRDDLNKTVTIARSMLPADVVRDNLNKAITITRNMLPADLLSEDKRTATSADLFADGLGIDVLDILEVTAKLDQNRMYQEEIEFQETKRLAEGGDKIAQFNLGVMYGNGKGVPQDYKLAVKWYTKAAEQGDAKTQFNLGLMYDNGKGVPQDYKLAVKWYTMSAEQGNAEAQSNLGINYAKGEGVAQDDNLAAKWFRMSAEQGNNEAQYNLGFMYAFGEGVPQDDKEAYAWLSVAKANGLELAEKNLGIVTKKMTKEQIVQAKSISIEISKRIEANKKD